MTDSQTTLSDDRTQADSHALQWESRAPHTTTYQLSMESYSPEPYNVTATQTLKAQRSCDNADWLATSPAEITSLADRETAEDVPNSNQSHTTMASRITQSSFGSPIAQVGACHQSALLGFAVKLGALKL